MKPCGRTMMDRKGWGGESSTHRVCRAVHSASLAHTQRVPSSALSFACAHTACVEQCAQLRLRTHRVCRAVRSASLAHTHRVCRTVRGIRLRTHTECAGQCAAYARAHKLPHVFTVWKIRSHVLRFPVACISPFFLKNTVGTGFAYAGRLCFAVNASGQESDLSAVRPFRFRRSGRQKKFVNPA